MNIRTAALMRGAVAILALGLATTACGVSADPTPGTTTAAGPVTGLKVMVPNSPGSGYDTTARAAAKALEDAGLAKNIEVFNVAGAGGTVGLQKLVNEKSSDKVLMQMGLGVVGCRLHEQVTGHADGHRRRSPSLIEESEAIVVPKDSPYNVRAGVGRSRGRPTQARSRSAAPQPGRSGPSHPDAVGEGGRYHAEGRQLRCIRRWWRTARRRSSASKVAFAATGVGEVAEQAKAGEVKILAVTSAERVKDVDAPTLKELGLDMVFTNWRGIVAGPGISDAQTKEYVDLLTRMHDTQEWKDTLAEKGWTDAFLAGDEFAAFLQSETTRVAGVLSDLGLT